MVVIAGLTILAIITRQVENFYTRRANRLADSKGFCFPLSNKYLRVEAAQGTAIFRRRLWYWLSRCFTVLAVIAFLVDIHLQTRGMK